MLKRSITSTSTFVRIGQGQLTSGRDIQRGQAVASFLFWDLFHQRIEGEGLPRTHARHQRQQHGSFISFSHCLLWSVLRILPTLSLFFLRIATSISSSSLTSEPSLLALVMTHHFPLPFLASHFSSFAHITAQNPTFGTTGIHTTTISHSANTTTNQILQRGSVLFLSFPPPTKNMQWRQTSHLIIVPQPSPSRRLTTPLSPWPKHQHANTESLSLLCSFSHSPRLFASIPVSFTTESGYSLALPPLRVWLVNVNHTIPNKLERQLHFYIVFTLVISTSSQPCIMCCVNATYIIQWSLSVPGSHSAWNIIVRIK